MTEHKTIEDSIMNDGPIEPRAPRVVPLSGAEAEAVKALQEPFVATELKKKADLFAERHAIYGDNYKRFGPIISLILDTQKIDVRSMKDMSRLGLLVQIVSKITRYGENFNRGGHDDSLDDIAVYAMMLKEVDRK